MRWEEGAHGEDGGGQQIDDGRTDGTRIVGPRAPDTHHTEQEEAPNTRSRVRGH